MSNLLDNIIGVGYLLLIAAISFVGGMGAMYMLNDWLGVSADFAGGALATTMTFVSLSCWLRDQPERTEI
jgi:hypothetical protein